MTNEEAADVLRPFLGMAMFGNETKEALRLAIAALEKEAQQETAFQDAMSDVFLGGVGFVRFTSESVTHVRVKDAIAALSAPSQFPEDLEKVAHDLADLLILGKKEYGLFEWRRRRVKAVAAYRAMFPAPAASERP